MKLDFLVKFVNLIFDFICELVVLFDQLGYLVFIIAFTRLNLRFKLTDFKEPCQLCSVFLFNLLFP